MKTRRFLFGSVVLPLTGMIVFSGFARAGSTFWTGGADAIWANANWNPVTIPGTGDKATFNGAGNANTTLNLGAGVTIKDILFDTAGAAPYTIGSGAVGSQTLTLNDTGSIVMNSTVGNNELFNAAITLGTATTSTYTFTNNSLTNVLTFSGNISGGTGGTAGTKTLTIGGAGNTFFGGNLNKGSATNINLTKTGSGALTVNPTSNSGSASGTIAVNAGKLAIDFTNAGANANLLSSFSPLSMGGGTLQIVGNGANASTQAFGSTAIASGFSTISVGTNNPTLTLGAITQTIGSALRYVGPATIGAANVAVVATGTIKTTTQGTQGGASGLANSTARTGVPTVGLYDWASTNLAGGTAAPNGNGTSPWTIVGGSQVTGFYAAVANGGTAANLDTNYDITGATASSAGGTAFLQTLRFNTNLATTFNNAGSVMLLNGILVTPNVGAFNVTFTGAKLSNGANGANTAGAISIWQNNTAGELVINTDIGQRTGTTTYVQAGDGTVVIGNASNTYTGQTNLLGGNTLVTNYANFGAVGTNAQVNLNGGAVVGTGSNFSMTSGVTNRAFVLGGNGGGLVATAGNTMTVAGVVSGAAGTGGLVVGIPASATNGSVAGLLPGTGSIANGQAVDTANTTAVFGTGTVALTGANTYFGGTTVLAGATLNIKGINNLGGANYGGTTLNSATLQYASSASGSGSFDISSGSGITLASGGGTIDTNGNVVTYANAIGNGASGVLTVKSAAGGGSLTLSAANGNTYTGGTTITSGTLSVTNTSGSGTGSGNVALNGGTLTGTGTITGTVTQAASTTLASGAAGTTLTLGGLTFNGGILSFALNGGTGIGTQTSGMISVTNATFTTTPTLSLSSVLNPANIVNGETFTLFSSPNTITGLSGLGPITGGTFGRITLTASQVLNTIVATATGSAANLVWAGGASGVTTGAISGNGTTWDNTQTNTVSGNWNNGGTYDYFYDNDNVTFNDTGSPTHTVNLTTANTAGTITVNTGSAYTFTATGSGKITGGSSLLVSGGTLNLNLANDYTGGTTINPGTTLKTGIAGALPGTGTVAVKGTLDLGGFNQTVGTLSDGSVSTGVVENTSGNNTLTVSNGGTYSGALINSASPSGNTLGLTLTGGTLALSGTNSYTGATAVSAGTLSLTGSGSLAGSNVTTSGTGVISEASGASINGSGITFTQGSSGTSTLAGANTYTGATSVSAGILNLTGSLSGSNVTTSGTGALTQGSGGVIGGSGMTFNQSSSGTSILAGANTYSGATGINGGVLQISATNNLGDGSATNTISFNAGGKLQSTANSYDLGANRAIDLVGAGTLQVDAGTLTVSGAISNVGALTKAGNGALTLTGADTASGVTTVSGGRLNVLTGGSINGTTSLTIANGASLNIAGGSVTLPATGNTTGGAYTSFTAGGNTTAVYISGGSLSYGNYIQADPNAALKGFFTQTGGAVTTAESNMAPNAADAFQFYLGGTGTGANAATYTSNRGYYGNFTVGTRGLANAYVSGTGELTVNGPAINGGAGAVTGIIVGAQFSGGTAGTRTFVQQGGKVMTSGLTLGAFTNANINSPGVYYLNGGTLTTSALSRGTLTTTTGTLNFGGGTFKSGAAFSTAANVVTNINSGGATIDTTGGDLTWSGAITAGTTGNVNGFTGLSGGSGYTSAPTAVFDNTGTGGTGATGTAVIDANGVVTDVVITNPGSGYTSTPTFALTGGGGTGASVTGTTIATGNGGLTKIGTGTLTLSGANTYTGATTISGGALALGASGSISNSSGVVLNGGNFNVSAVSGGYTLGSTQSLTGSGTVTGDLVVAGNLAIGNSPGTIDVSGNLGLTSTSVSDFQFTVGNFSANSFDLATGSGTVTFGGTLNLLFDSGETYADSSMVKIFDFGTGYAGSFNSVNFSGLGAGQSATFDSSTGFVTVIPEPKSAFLGLVGIVTLLRRRRIRQPVVG